MVAKLILHFVRIPALFVTDLWEVVFQNGLKLGFYHDLSVKRIASIDMEVKQLQTYVSV